VAYLVLKSGFGARSGFGGPPREIELGIDPSRFAEAEFLKGMVMAESFSGMEDLFKDPQRASEEMRKNLEGLEKAKDLPPEFRKHLQQMLSGLEGVLKKVDPKALAGAPKQEMLKIETQPVARSAAGPRSSFEVTFAQSVLWALLGCVSAFSISVVTERMQGTLLRLRTSPLTWGQIIAGKGLACFLASVGVTVLLLAIAWLFLGVRLDQPLKLALAVVCTSVAFTGIMMFVSTLGKTEQSVAGAGWGIMMPLAMIGGCMVPLIAMPGWMQTASSASPVKWGIVALEGAIWRGFTYEEMLLPCTILLGVGVVFFALGVKLLSRQET
jgi:ABC-2 type transport system permease protein